MSATKTMKTLKEKPKRYKYKLKRKTGQTDKANHGKLTDELEEEICKLIRGQMSLTDACAWVGISRVAVWEWRARGQAEPESRYGQFDRAIEKAYTVAKAYLIRGIAQHSDVKGKIFILKNRYPEEFRDRIVQEVSGPGGASVPVTLNVNPFEVKIVMSGEPEQFKTVAFDGRELTQGLN
jgi:hypothetical protein